VKIYFCGAHLQQSRRTLRLIAEPDYERTPEQGERAYGLTVKDLSILSPLRENGAALVRDTLPSPSEPGAAPFVISSTSTPSTSTSFETTPARTRTQRRPAAHARINFAAPLLCISYRQNTD
jgi:hypothetical protein